MENANARKKRNWYSTLSTDEREQFNKKRKEARAQKKFEMEKHFDKRFRLNDIPFENEININSSHIQTPLIGGAEYSFLTTYEKGSTSTQLRMDPVLPSSRDRSLRKRNHVISTLQDIVQKPDVLPSEPSCAYCHAVRFYHETKGFCCANGEISLAESTIPFELYDLLTSHSDEAKEFQKYIRTYNNTFAFTSFGVKYDKNLCRRNKGIYTFRIQGQVYHFINELLPSNERPSYLQLYFYDTEHELDHRIHNTEKLNPIIVKKIMNILNINPYCRFFQNLKDVQDVRHCQILLHSNSGLDQRIYNTPSISQVAAMWVEDDSSQEREGRHIIVHGHTGFSHKVEYYFGCYDPLQYPLLFPNGQNGWHRGIQRINKNSMDTQYLRNSSSMLHAIPSVVELLQREKSASLRKQKRGEVSCREYYCYKLQVRPSQTSLLLRSGRLLQQYVVDMYVKLETSRLDYFRSNQDDIRADLYQGIIDSIECGETQGSKVGRRIILPASFIGGPRDMKKRYMDAMALVQKFGKPDIFLTMTCNPNWVEIKENLAANEEIQNRPDLVARVFRSKLEELKLELFKKQIFGSVVASVYVIEFQKRGLPHAHFLIILASNEKIYAPESFDKIVFAEIPNKNIVPHLYAMVVKHMMHGPCGHLNPTNACMTKKGNCRNHYPKLFSSVTTHGKNSYPKYRRRDDGNKVKVRGAYLDNRWVVPYNAYLLAKFDCHINVEICSTIKAVKYLYKYIYKGHDRIAFKVAMPEESNTINEIDDFQSARWLSAPESMWRIYGFTLNEIHPAVYSLQLHLQDKQLVTFRKRDKLSNIANSDMFSRTMLTDYFRLNQCNEVAQGLLYKEIPQHFVWNRDCKIWTSRKKGNVIGRIVTAHPAEGERYYLRLLLNHIRGATSFDDLKTFKGTKVGSFRESALLHGLLDSDNSLDECLEEACTYQMPYTLRRLFATILVYCKPTDPRKLWERFKSSMFDSFPNLSCNCSSMEIETLKHLRLILESMSSNINDYRLVDYSITENEDEKQMKEINDEMHIFVSEEDLSLQASLNFQQKRAYDMILERVFKEKSGAFFIDGPGGTGKTYLYRALLATVRSKGMIALATASSGVAAAILPGGRTAHSRFKIPLTIDERISCAISKQSSLAKAIQRSKLIIWDEAPMSHRRTIEAFDQMLQDINESEECFGGKVVVLGGDFRQVLPVVQKATKEETINASLVKSYLWPRFERIMLTENMRARLDPGFCDFLLRIGNGEASTIDDETIEIPSSLIIPFEDSLTSLSKLVNAVFPNINQYFENIEMMINRAILTPKNDYADDINNLLIHQFPGDVTTYCSFDETNDKNEQSIQEDFLNSFTPSGFPPHQLVLKKNCPIMLLRNINPSEGLCNGTRLICCNFSPNVIDAEIITGHYRGKRVFLPRIPFIPIEGEKNGIPFKRTQFPIRLSFAMTINKAQGQTLDYVGIYLPEPVFSHGQLYVALSRAKTMQSIKILIRPTLNNISDDQHTKNIVYHELLNSIKSQ